MISSRFGENCIQLNNRNIVCKDNEETSHNNKVYFNCNGENFFKIKIDGCVEPKGGPNLRCDFMIIGENEQIELYIELKGGDISRAVDQIMSTINNHGLSTATKYSAIVATSVPRKVTAKDKAKKLLTKKTKTVPFIKNKKLCLDYSQGKINQTN